MNGVIETLPETSFRALPVVLCLLLVAVTLAVYWPVTRCDFLNYDDPEYFTSNHHVLAGLTPGGVRLDIHRGTRGQLASADLAVVDARRELFGRGPAGPHVTNLLFHLANTVLLFLLLRC